MNKKMNSSPVFKTYEDQQKAKSIWLVWREKLPTKEIFLRYMGEFFKITNGQVGGRGDDRMEFLKYLSTVAGWKREMVTEQLGKEMETISDEEIIEVQNKNRKKLILILRNVLNQYERNPDLLKNLGVTEISSLYRIVQSAEEAAKRTELSQKRLKLEAVRAILPYHRLPVEELKKLKDSFVNGIDQIIKLKSGEPVGRSETETGGS
jgi:hypothetical protein